MNPVTALYDPRPLDDPAYWDPCPTYEEFCVIVSQLLEEEYDKEVEPAVIGRSFYVRKEYEFGVDYEAAAKLYFELEIDWED